MRRELAICGLLLLAACDKGPKPACDNGATATLSGNHGHEVEIPAERTAQKGGIPIKGGTHEHSTVLRDEDLEKLRKGEKVTTRTSSVNAHVHEIEVRCK